MGRRRDEIFDRSEKCRVRELRYWGQRKVRHVPDAILSRIACPADICPFPLDVVVFVRCQRPAGAFVFFAVIAGYDPVIDAVTLVDVAWTRVAAARD